jgi:hypothetical protein
MRTDLLPARIKPPDKPPDISGAHAYGPLASTHQALIQPQDKPSSSPVDISSAPPAAPTFPIRAAGWMSTAYTSELRLCGPGACQKGSDTSHATATSWLATRWGPPVQSLGGPSLHEPNRGRRWLHRPAAAASQSLPDTHGAVVWNGFAAPPGAAHLQCKRHDLLPAPPQRVRDAVRLQRVVALEVEQRVAVGGGGVQ